MGVRGFVGVLLLLVLLPSVAEAADCIAVRQGEVSIVRGAGCGELKLVSHTGEQVIATWVEFSEPGSPAEWRYNDWVHRQVARRADRFAIESLYRSDRLISARYSSHRSVNVDVRRWTLFSPDDLVSLGAAANACWRQFADGRASFAAAWPNARPWADRDFERRPFGWTMREVIGSDVIDPQPSTGRTRRVFVEVLRDQARWWFNEHGAQIDFGELLGKTAAPFSCSFANADLKTIAQPGATVPP